MKFFPILAFLIAFPYCSAYGATSASSAANWAVAKITIDGFQTCQLQQQVSPDDLLVVTVGPPSSGAVSFTFGDNDWNIKNTDSIKIQIDNGSVFEVSPLVVDPNTFGFVADGDVLSDLLNEFAVGKTINITDTNMKNGNFSMPLSDETKALTALAACSQALTPVDTTPDTDPTPVPSAPVTQPSVSGQVSI